MLGGAIYYEIKKRSEVSIKCFFFLFFVIVSSSSYGQDITLTINGKIVAKPCTVLTSTTFVDLGEFTTSDFLKPGSVSEWKKLKIYIGGCPAGTSKVNVKFSGKEDANGYYKNLGDSGNIQIMLSDMNGDILNNGEIANVNINGNPGEGIIELKVRAVSVNGNASQGSIFSVISMIYTYI